MLDVLNYFVKKYTRNNTIYPYDSIRIFPSEFTSIEQYIKNPLARTVLHTAAGTNNWRPFIEQKPLNLYDFDPAHPKLQTIYFYSTLFPNLEFVVPVNKHKGEGKPSFNSLLYRLLPNNTIICTFRKPEKLGPEKELVEVTFRHQTDKYTTQYQIAPTKETIKEIEKYRPYTETPTIRYLLGDKSVSAIPVEALERASEKATKDIGTGSIWEKTPFIIYEWERGKVHPYGDVSSQYIADLVHGEDFEVMQEKKAVWKSVSTRSGNLWPKNLPDFAKEAYRYILSLFEDLEYPPLFYRVDHYNITVPKGTVGDRSRVSVHLRAAVRLNYTIEMSIEIKTPYSGKVLRSVEYTFKMPYNKTLERIKYLFDKFKIDENQIAPYLLTTKEVEG